MRSPPISHPPGRLDTSGIIVPAPPWRVGPGEWDFRHPLLMGVLNVTPDSFSDGGEFLHPARALERARQMAAEGADLLDLGGASSHPKAKPVSPGEELDRLAPIVEKVLAEVPLPLSIDTQTPEVAEACLALGAHLINDVSGFPAPAMAGAVARRGVPLVITYNNYNLPKEASGLSFLSDMLAFFDERIEEAVTAGVSRILLDPGYGFGKTLEENLILLRSLPLLKRFNRPLLVCTSRKGSLGRITGEAIPRERLGASLASSLYAVQQGAQMVRVHDVKAFRQALLTWRALERYDGEGGTTG